MHKGIMKVRAVALGLAFSTLAIASAQAQDYGDGAMMHHRMMRHEMMRHEMMRHEMRHEMMRHEMRRDMHRHMMHRMMEEN